MFATKNFLKELIYTYPKSKKQVAFYDHKRFSPAKYDGQKDIPVFSKKDSIDKFGIENKKGEQLVELYIYVKNQGDKYSVYDQRVKEKLVEGKGMICETKMYPEAYEKYLNFKKNGCITKSDEEKQQILKDNLVLQEEVARLQEERKKELEKIKKLEEFVSASSEPKKKVDDDSIDDLPKHSKGRKK